MAFKGWVKQQTVSEAEMSNTVVVLLASGKRIRHRYYHEEGRPDTK